MLIWYSYTQFVSIIREEILNKPQRAEFRHMYFIFIVSKI